jgi:hypothetical protein
MDADIAQHPFLLFFVTRFVANTTTQKANSTLLELTESGGCNP